MTKEELIRKFGIKFIDAMIQFLAEEFSKSEQEIIDGIADKLCDTGGICKIDDYDWSGELD